jgi:hypothetical protein
MGFIMNETEWPPRRCSGESCHQGRAECKTPEACQLPEPADTFLSAYSRSLLSAALVLACVLVVVVLSL